MNRRINVLKMLSNHFAVLRCKPNSKLPFEKHGFLDAQFNRDIETLLRNNCNIGIACAKSGVIVLDLDVDEAKEKNGLKDIEGLESKLGKLPVTLTQLTPRGGKHLFFSSKGIEKPIGKIGKAIDIRYNAYVLAEPSSINGKSYKFTDDGLDDNGNIIIAELPPKWLNYLNKASPAQFKAQKSTYQHHERKIIEGNFKLMYDNCLFVKHCVDNAVTLSEIEWFYFACILSSLSNGEELFDTYSKPHKDYDPILVKKKFQNAKKYNVNCKTVSRIFENCTHCKKEK